VARARDHFLPKLKVVLRNAYSGDAEAVKAGAAAIGKCITDAPTREELLKTIGADPEAKEQDNARK